MDEPHLAIDIVLHAGTLAATLVYYRSSVLGMIGDGCGGLLALGRGGRGAAILRERGNLRLLVLLIVGTLPTAVFGLFFGRFFNQLFDGSFEQILGAPRMVAGMLLVTAALLMATRFVGDGARGIRELTVWHALAIGLVQGLAIIPGISRSGATIVCALSLGIERELAARYSFLLAVPATIGALALEALGGGMWALDPLLVGAGFVTAASVGLVALAVLIPVVRRGRLYLFALYLVPVGLAWLVWM